MCNAVKSVVKGGSVLFIGTQYSNLYTAVDTPAEAAWFYPKIKGHPGDFAIARNDLNNAWQSLRKMFENEDICPGPHR
jgi:hypothetical protein